MLESPRLDDEEGRLLALKRFRVLDTPEEAPFEKIVSLVRQVLDVPICAVSLVDARRQWFKARRGLSVRETPRDVSFCTHTIQGAEPFVVTDARADPRFADNPLVRGDPFIRSYAGVPLTSHDGYNLGSLCAIDTRARPFPDSEIAILENFARLVMDQLELRQIAARDDLTGALNRRGWMDRAATELERSLRYRHPATAILLDIDHFKRVNDTHGHAAGDTVLKAVAATCMDIVRDSDAFGRTGGEEFAILLPETAGPAGAALAERCRKAIEGLRVDIGAPEPISVTASFGVSSFAPGLDALDGWIARTDKALYDAKEGGRNRVALDA